MSLYQYHCENLRQIESGFDSTVRILRDSISKNKENDIVSFTRMLTYLLSCWTEVRLHKIIEETHSSSFTETQKRKILKTGASLNSVEVKWKYTINIAVCKAFNFSETTDRSAIESYLNTDLINRTRYINIMGCLENDLRSSITLRNKVAHGQWVHALNRDNTAKNTDITNEMNDMNIVTLQLKQKMYESLANIINDLVVSPTTFQRDYDRNYSALIANQRNYHQRDYNSYRTSMRSKYLRGIQKRKENFESTNNHQ